jgi:hypothetical protein
MMMMMMDSNPLPLFALMYGSLLWAVSLQVPSRFQFKFNVQLIDIFIDFG